MKKDIKNKFVLFFFMTTFLPCFSQQGEMINSARLLMHKPVSSEYAKSLESRLEWIYKKDISDKIYIVNDLVHAILTFKNKPLSEKDTTEYEWNFIKLLAGVDTIKNIIRIVALTDCSSGDMYSCYDYVFIETDDGCICNINGSNAELGWRNCNIDLLNNFLYYLKKRKAIPKKKYLKRFVAENEFRVFEITKDKIYANKFYTTYQYKVLDELIGQWR